MLLRALTSAIDYLEAIHTLKVEMPAGTIYGVLWNDIKPDHFFWDPVEAHFTFIDWGNAQFLESDGITKDRQHSRMGDFHQLLSSLGQFILEAAPELYQELHWPENILPANAYTAGILPLKERANELLKEEEASLRRARLSESDILQDFDPTLEQINQLGIIHQEITSKGEIPDHLGCDSILFPAVKKTDRDWRYRSLYSTLRTGEQDAGFRYSTTQLTGKDCRNCTNWDTPTDCALVRTGWRLELNIMGAAAGFTRSNRTGLVE